MTNPNPKNEIGNIKCPAYCFIQSPGSDACHNLIGHSHDPQSQSAQGNQESGPPQSSRFLLHDA